jgi:HTH-type transcriptional regulator/antitoxin HipB
MPYMKDKLRTPLDLGVALKALRRERKLKAVAIAGHSGRSRDVLNRLEKGQDVTVHSLFDILRAMGLCVRIESAGMPTLEEMQTRFAEDDHDDDSAA